MYMDYIFHDLVGSSVTRPTSLLPRLFNATASTRFLLALDRTTFHKHTKSSNITNHTIKSLAQHINTFINCLFLTCQSDADFSDQISEKALPTQQLIPLQVKALPLSSFLNDAYLLSTFTSNILINWYKPEGRNFHAGLVATFSWVLYGQKSHMKFGSKQLQCNHGATQQKPAQVFFTVAASSLVLSLYHSILIVLNSRTTRN